MPYSNRLDQSIVFRTLFGWLFSLYYGTEKNIAKKTSSGIPCADCGINFGLMKWNYAEHLPETDRQGKAGLCNKCVRKYTTTCPECATVWSVDPDKCITECPRCSGQICSDCLRETNILGNAIKNLPESLRQGKAGLCPDCVKECTIPCEKCGFDWHVDVAQKIVVCPVCCLADATGCSDIRQVLVSSAFLSRIPNLNSPDEILDVVGVIYRRGHPHYLDQMGGFLVLTETRLYFLGTHNPDFKEAGFRDIHIPFPSSSAVSELNEGGHAKSAAAHNEMKKTVGNIALAAGTALGLVNPFQRMAASQDINKATPPPKNRLTIASRNKEVGRLTAVFDIIDVSNDKIEKTAVEFRKRLFSFASQFDVGKKPETTQQATAPQPVGEKFRIFRAGKLLGMITSQEIEAKYADKTLQQTDFVLLPLETFLAEIKTPDSPFQLFRDGKRIDQYTLQQIKELNESGQTQPIDHVLLPMQVFLERNSS